MNTQYHNQDISLTRNLKEDLRERSAGYADGKIFLILESNTWKHCWPLVSGFRAVPETNIVVLKAGEENKNIEQVMAAWDALGRAGADRSSLVINIGGGMLTDLAGFAASTFKRGLAMINVPTTLLAMVDASAGGKNGINFRGLKNEIGVIRQPMHVCLYLTFLRTLDRENILSGYAEMLKAGLIADRSQWDRLKTFNFESHDPDELEKLIWRSVEIKKQFTDADPDERGIRKALNFGHTIGHALESESLHSARPLPHGYAVAYGMIAEAILSHYKTGLPAASVEEIRDTVTRLYGTPPDTIRNADVLLDWMRFDKKNRNNRINFTLLEEIGKCRVDVEAAGKEIRMALREA